MSDRPGTRAAIAIAARVAKRSALAKLGIASLAGCAAVVALALILAGWLTFGAQTSAGQSCGGDAAAGTADRGGVPGELVPIIVAASWRYRLGARGPAVLAALTKVESDFGRNMGPSSAGAIGWTQFMPATWAAFGVDADGDGRRDPFSAADAIHSSARYLRASGAPGDWYRALFAYNHADWYVDRVLRQAEAFAPSLGAAAADAPGPCDPVLLGQLGAARSNAPGSIVPLPGFPGDSIDERLVADVALLRRRFRIHVTDGYAATGHAADGEHPLGLAVDIVPGPGGSWEDIDELARWAEPRQNAPRPPWRWVGYDGDAGHGRGHHLHLSWEHGPGRPASWVMTLVSR